MDGTTIGGNRAGRRTLIEDAFRDFLGLPRDVYVPEMLLERDRALFCGGLAVLMTVIDPERIADDEAGRVAAAVDVLEMYRELQEYAGTLAAKRH